MEVIDPGHLYNLDCLDTTPDFRTEKLTFVKRQGDKYPGNVGYHPGTTIQEVMRVIIDRLQYVNDQMYSSHDEVSIRYARGIILELETRAAKQHGRRIFPRHDIENEPTCKICGHIQCNETCRPKEAEIAVEP